MGGMRDAATSSADASTLDSTVQDGARASTASAAPVFAVVATFASAFLVYAALALSIETPRAFSDELLYFKAASAVTDGDGLTIRGEPYRYGPLYPALLVPVHWIAQDRETAYQFAKILNSLFFALTVFPIFLLARRVLMPWPAVGAAALSVAVPSMTYVSVVMTESVAYFAFAWTLYVIVRALECACVLRQFAALLAVLLASGVRTQFLVLFVVYTAGVVTMIFVFPRQRSRRAVVASLWPTWTALSVGFCGLLVAAVFASEGSTSLLGNYSVLLGSYDPIEVGKWLVYHLANLELYLVVAPIAVAPIALASLWANGRSGARTQAAFLVLFLATNSSLLLLTAAFNTTIYAQDLLHDRPVFYVLPLWLITFFVWSSSGMRRPITASVVGVAIAIALPLTLPFAGYARGNVAVQFEAASTALWVTVKDNAPGFGVSGQLVLFVFVAVVLVAVLTLPARVGYVLPALVLVVFVVTAELSWFSASSWADARGRALPTNRVWVDERVPAEAFGDVADKAQPVHTRCA